MYIYIAVKFGLSSSFAYVRCAGTSWLEGRAEDWCPYDVQGPLGRGRLPRHCVVRRDQETPRPCRGKTVCACAGTRRLDGRAVDTAMHRDGLADQVRSKSCERCAGT